MFMIRSSKEKRACLALFFGYGRRGSQRPLFLLCCFLCRPECVCQGTVHRRRNPPPIKVVRRNVEAVAEADNEPGVWIVIATHPVAKLGRCYVKHPANINGTFAERLNSDPQAVSDQQLVGNCAHT